MLEMYEKLIRSKDSRK